MSRPVEWTRAEVAATNHTDPHIIIDNVVYAVQRWLDEHPGGKEVLLNNAGQDATQCFMQQGHSTEARGLMRRFAAGRVVQHERWVELGARLPGPEALHDGGGSEGRPWEPDAAMEDAPMSVSSLLAAAGPPFLLAVCAIVLYTYCF